MLRRGAVSLLFGALTGVKVGASNNLSRLLDPGVGSALILDVHTRRILATNSAVRAGNTLMPPGSTLKPFVLAALLQRGKLRPDTSFFCPTRLTIGNRRLDCTHPPLAVPMRPDTAVAYSCNCFVAHAAEQFQPGELAAELQRLGFASPTGLLSAGELSGKVVATAAPDAIRLQALGETGVMVTPLELALGYRQLALKIGTPEMQPILAGLEGAVEYGTAQRARLEGTKVAGKTGSTRSAAGESIACSPDFCRAARPSW